MKTKIVRGRAFTQDETFATSDLPPTILSDTAAKLIFGDDDPLGQIITEPGRPSHDYIVVGVTQPVRWDSVQKPYNAVIYRTYGAGLPQPGGSLVVRSSQPFAVVKQQIASAAMSIDPTIPLTGYEQVTTTIDGRFGSKILFAYVLGILGAIGFLLAAVGLHGLVAQMVAERTREFAIRLAIVAGVAAWLAGRLVQAQVFGVSVRSPFIFAMSTGALVVVVAVALIGPLRATLRVQPISVLRSE